MSSTTPGEGSGPWRARPWVVPLAVGLCCVASLVLKLALNADRTGAAHGDTAYYYNLARSLVSGKGFTLDYVPIYLSHPDGIPCPANTWWMPMASLLGAVGMLLGGATYAAGQCAVIVLSSLAPLLVYLLGRDVLASRAAGLLGALLAVCVHPYLDHASVLNSPGPYLVFCSLALWLMARAARDPRYLPWTGACIGLVQLTRSDGVLLWGALVLTLALRGRPWPWKHLAGAALACLLVLAPLLASNWHYLGTPFPSNHKYGVLLGSYGQLYSLPENVTLQSFLEPGWKSIAETKLRVAAINARSFLGFLAHGPGGVKEGDFLSSWIEGLGPPQYSWRNGGILALGLVAWCGLILCRGRALAGFWCHACLLWILYSFVFTYTGVASMRVSMIGLSGLMLAAASRFLLWLGERLAPVGRSLGGRSLGGESIRRWSVRGALAALVLYAACSHAWLAAEQIAAKSANIHVAEVYHAWILETFILPHGLEDDPIMARDVHELHANTGLQLYSLPVDSLDEVLQVSQRYGVRFALVDYDAREPPPLALGDQPGFEVGPALANGGRVVALIRLHPEVLSKP